MNAPSDVIVIGAGVIGSAIAYFASQQGLSVTVLERGLPASGTSSACEGNILVSDKELGPELELTKFSLDTWRGEAIIAPCLNTDLHLIIRIILNTIKILQCLHCS